MSDSGMHVVKVKVKLANAAQQGSELRDAIQKSLNTATKQNPIVVRDFSYRVNKEDVRQFRVALQQQITNEMQHNPIRLSFKAASITKQERQAMLADLQADLDRQNLVINVKEINATEAVNSLKSQLTNMLSGLTIGGLKAFLDSDAMSKAVTGANNKTLDTFSRTLSKAFEGIKTADVAAEMTAPFREILLMIEQARDLEGDAQREAVTNIGARIDGYRKELELKQRIAEQTKKEEKNKEVKAATVKKDADDSMVAGIRVEALQKKVDEARRSLDKLDDIDVKKDVEAQLDAITQRLGLVPELSKQARDELIRLITTDVSGIEKQIKESLNTPEREQNDTEIKSLIQEYDALIKKVREVYTDNGERDAVIAKLREEQNEVRTLKEATTQAQTEALSGIRDKIALSQKEIDIVIQKNKAIANQDKTEAAAARRQTANAQRAVALQKTIQSWIGKNTKAYKQYRVQVDQMLQTLQREGSLTQQELSDIALQLSKIQTASRQAGILGQTMFGSLGSLFDKFKGASIAAMIGDKIWDKARDAITAIKDIDAAMTELRKVTDLTEQSYENFTKTATNMSRGVGATLADTINATADFARLGYDINESAALAEAALTYKNVGDGISDISVATESLISTLKAFDIEALDSMEIVDKYNEVGNTFAISSAGIGEALRRSAAALAAAGNDINESIGLVTGMNTVVQDPDVVGTALKTVSMYLRAAKTDAEEAGISTDGMAESVSELRNELRMLTGIDIQINDDTFKSTYQIMKEIAGVWDQLTDVTQANVLQLIGGKRNGNVVTSLLKNFDEAANAAKTAQDATGSAAAENEKYLDSINGKLQIMQANFEALVNSVIDSDLVKFFLDLGNVILSAANSLQEMNALLPLIGLGLNIGAGIKSQSKANDALGQITSMGAGLLDSDIVDQTDNYKRVIASVGLEIGKLNRVQQEGIAIKLNSAVAEGKISKALVDQIYNLNLLPASYQAAGKAVTGFGGKILGVLKSAGSLLNWIEIAMAAYSIFKGFKDRDAQKRQDTIDEGRKISSDFDAAESNYKKNIAKLQDLKAEYDELAKGVDRNGANISLTASEYDRFLEIVSQIEKITPSVVDAYENQADGVNKYKDAIIAATEAEKKAIEQAKTNKIAGTGDLVAGAREEYKDVMTDISKDALKVWNTVDKLINESTAKSTEPLEKVLGGDLYRDYIGLDSDMSPADVAKALSEGKEQIINNLRKATDDDGNLLFSEQYISEVSQAIDVIDNKLKSVGETAGRVRDQFVFKMENAGYDQNVTAQYEQIMAAGLGDAFAATLSDAIDLTASDGGESAALAFTQAFASSLASGSFAYMETMVRYLSDGKIQIEEFNRALKYVYDPNGDSISQAMFDYFSEKGEHALNVANGLADYNIQVSKIANGPLKMFAAGQKGYELLGQAMEEMANDGEVGMDVLSKLQDILPDGIDIMERFVDMSTGKRVFKENEFRDFWKSYIYSEADMLSSEANRLETESAYYDAMAKSLHGENAALTKLLKEYTNQSGIFGEFEKQERKTTKEALEGAGFSADGFNEKGLFLTSMSAGASDDKNAYDFAYDANVVFTLTPVYHDKDTGEDIPMSADKLNEYVADILARSGGDVNKAMDLDAAERQLFIRYDLVDDEESLESAVRSVEERNKLFNTSYMVQFDQENGAQDFSVREMEARSKATAEAAQEQREAAEDYVAAMQGVESTSNLQDLSTMWDALEKQAQSSSVILEAQKQVAEGTALTQAQLMELSREHPDYNWFATAGDIEKQTALLRQAATEEKAAFADIIETRKRKLIEAKSQDGADHEAIQKQVDILTAIQNSAASSGLSLMEILFPTDQTKVAEDQQRKLEEVIQTVGNYQELMQTVQKEIDAGGKLTPETMLSMRELFGEGWKDFLKIDPSSGQVLGVVVKKVTDHVNNMVDTELQAIDTTGEFSDAIKAGFSADPGELKASERLENYMSLVGEAYALIGQADRELASGGSNSLGTLENLVSLMGDDYASALDFSSGKIRILTDKVATWQDEQIASYAGMDEAERAAIEGAYKQAAAMENLKGAINDVGDASSLIDTIQEEIAENGYNSFETLASFIDTMGDDWQKHVSFSSNGIVLSTQAVYDQMAASIDSVIGASHPLNEQLKRQLQTSLEVESATRSLSDAYSGLETAVSGYTNIGSGVELTHDMISQLIEVDSRYAQAIEYQNGRLQLNKQKYDEVTQSVQENTKAQAEAAAQAILSGEEYQSLVKKMMDKNLTANEQNRLDSLNAQVMAFEVMASAVDSSTSALQRFLNATDQVNAVTYDGAKEAYQTIQDVLYNKDSDMYGMVGHEKFEEAMKLMISPDVEIDTKEFDRQYKILTRYFEDSGKGMDTLYKDMIKTGIIDKATGQIETTVAEAAKLLGLTEEAFRYAVDQYNQYQQDEYKIDIGGKTNEQLQEESGIGKMMEDIQTIQTAREDMEKTPLAIPVDPSLEGIAAVNLGLTDTQQKIGTINNTPMQITPVVNTEATDTMNDYIAGLKDEARIEVNASKATRTLERVESAATATTNELSETSNAAHNVSTNLDSINGGEMDVDTSGILKDLVNVLNRLGEIIQKLHSIDGMDVDANVNVNQKTSSSGSYPISSSDASALGKYLFGNASAGGTRKSVGGKTLVGELGTETVVDPSTNKWYTVGASGPEFVDLPKNAIVLNADQTRELFNAGRTSGRGATTSGGTTFTGRSMATGNFAEDDKEELIFVDWRKAQKEAQDVVDAITSAAPTVSQVVEAAKAATSSSSEKVSGTTKKPKTSSSNKSGSGGSSSSSKDREEEQSVLEKLQEQYQKLIDQHEHLIEHQEFLFRNAERGMDFGGMETSLENQVKIYKDMMADAQKGISEMVANGASDTDEELQSLEQAYWDAHDSMYEALEELSTLYVDGLTEKIDGIQSAYGNLSNAANELAETGSISVDTFQALINNGVEYMSLLEKVNGQYVINEEGINKLVAAEKKRLAVESALSYLGQVQQAVNDKDTHLLENLTELSNRIGQSSWDAVYAQAELLKNMGLTGDQYNAVIENINALKAVSEAVSGDITSDAKEANNAVTGGLKDQQSALDEILKITQDLIEHETEERIEAIEDEIDQFKEIIKLKKESLKVTRDENDYMDSVAEKTAEIARVQAKIDQLSLDDSRSALAEKAALQEELAKLQKDLGDLQGDHAYDAQIEALEKQEEAYEKDRQDEITSLEESIGSAEKLYQASIERLNSGWGSLYEQLIAWNTEIGSSLNSEITDSWKQAAEAVKLYGSYSAAVKNLDAAINAGKDKNIAVSKSDLPVFHSGGVVGGSGIGNEIMAVVQKGEVIINEAGQEVLYRIIDFQRYLGEKLGSAFGSMDLSSGTMRNAVSSIPSALGALSGTSAESSGAFVFSPTISVEINGNGDMNSRNAKQFGEKIAATAIDQLREAFGRKGVSGSMSTRLRQS